MNPAPILSLLLLAAPLAALAQAADPLDLRLKNDSTFSVADPPGTYYGDHSGPVPRQIVPVRSELDDGKVHLHGAFTTGMGHSSSYGSSTYNAADLSIGKAFTSQAGGSSVMHMDIHLSRGDGPDAEFGGDFDRPWPGAAAGMPTRRVQQDPPP